MDNLSFLCLQHPTLSAKALCFQGCPSIYSFIPTDFVTMISHERFEYSLAPTDDWWFDSGGQRSKPLQASRSNLVNTMTHELLEQSQFILQGVTNSPYW